MESVSSRQLKNKTGAVLSRVRKGERIVVTNHGKEVAIIVPVADKPLLSQDQIRPFDEAWASITATLSRAKPGHENRKQAVDRTRRRR